ncbi:hypothetical protein CXF59_00355 [Flavobacterium sp. ALD4]|uniref:SWIM zinc finger family protein n=1 Tax=Flavobacterium sp. ALD4 TaxID=2058314 RepID=UPI000C3318B5|nr:hypothetical protein CXF59_00355 [Flavobacterium sp. ALD4]
MIFLSIVSERASISFAFCSCPVSAFNKIPCVLMLSVNTFAMAISCNASRLSSGFNFSIILPTVTSTGISLG